jgi:hypothetical protein
MPQTGAARRSGLNDNLLPKVPGLIAASAEAMSKITAVRFSWSATYDVQVLPAAALAAVGEFQAPDRLRALLSSTDPNPAVALSDEVIAIGNQMWRRTEQQRWIATDPRFYRVGVNPAGVIAIGPEMAPYLLNAKVVDEGNSYIVSGNWDIPGWGSILGFGYGPFRAPFPLIYVGQTPQPAIDQVVEHLILRIDKESMLLQSIETTTIVPVAASEYGPARMDTFRVGLTYSDYADPTIVVTAPTDED